MTLEEKDLEARILAYMKTAAYKPLTDAELAEAMHLTDEDLVAFWPALESLERQAEIIKTRNDRYGTPPKLNLIVGRLSMTSKGFGFLIPEVRESETDTDVFIPNSGLLGAMDGDRVLVRLTTHAHDGRTREGEVVRIVQHAHEKIVGTFDFDTRHAFGFVKPDDTKIQEDIFIPREDVHGAKSGMKVVVQIRQWPYGRRNAEGEIIEILGVVGTPGVDILSVMRQYELVETFPEAAQAQANAISRTVPANDNEGRRDRRDLPIVTVDGDDAKDLDDGVYAEARSDGGWFLGVYIADVSYYVPENSPLDLEARRRGTSVYLVDRVIPMLPKRLSNGICSLNAGEDRFALACEMEIGTDGTVKKHEIIPTRIRVHHRLTYGIVNRILVDKDKTLCKTYADILPLLQNLRAVREAMKKARRERGTIDFDIPETRAVLDEHGHAIALQKRVGSLAESIIEECMLAANETVAEHMEKKLLPFIYRVHERPTEEKLQRLNDLLANFSLHIIPDKNGEVQPKAIQRILEAVKGRPEERIVSTVSLRSMQQARYADESLGHFGLAARYYTHFTSPIRRYPDLIVHRLLRETLATGTIARARQEKLRSLLPEIADHASAMERRAIEAERETQDMKKIEYMQGFVGQDFSATISGVTAFGLFVELDIGVEGLVHVSSMVNDYYEYQEQNYALVGEMTNVRYRLGDAVEVTLVRANVEARTLDFILKDNGVYIAPPKKPKKAPQDGASAALQPTTKKKGKHAQATGKILAHKKGRGKKKREILALETTSTPHHGKHKKRNSKHGAQNFNNASRENAPNRPHAFWMSPPKKDSHPAEFARKPKKNKRRSRARHRLERDKK